MLSKNKIIEWLEKPSARVVIEYGINPSDCVEIRLTDAEKWTLVDALERMEEMRSFNVGNLTVSQAEQNNHVWIKGQDNYPTAHVKCTEPLTQESAEKLVEAFKKLFE